MVQEHEKQSDKTLNQHKHGWAGSKIIMYSAQHTVEVKVRKLQLFGEGRNLQGHHMEKQPNAL